MSENDRTRLIGRGERADAAPAGAAAASAKAASAQATTDGERVLSGKYKLLRSIGRGGMGEVFEALHLVTGKRVAVKLLKARGGTSRERFMREAQSAASIQHPNIVDVYDVGEDGDDAYLVMELFVGESLRARITRAKMEPHEAVSMLMPALRGVAAAHARGIVHRDLKPDNVFLCDRGPGIAPEAKVLDFGLSKDLAPARDGRPSNLTATDIMLGTPIYMAPEQARSSKTVDHRADVYALALVLYEMIAGVRLLAAHAHQELSAQIERGIPPFRRELAAKDTARALERVLLSALVETPAERTQSVAELARALEPFGHVSFEGGLRMSALHAASTVAAPARRTPNAGRLAVGALLLVALAALGWVVLRRAAEPGAAAVESGQARPAPALSSPPPPASQAASADSAASRAALPPQVSAPSAPSPMAPATTPSAPATSAAAQPVSPAPPSLAPATTPAPSVAAPRSLDSTRRSTGAPRSKAARASRSPSGALGHDDF